MDWSFQAQGRRDEVIEKLRNADPSGDEIAKEQGYIGQARSMALLGIAKAPEDSRVGVNIGGHTSIEGHVYSLIVAFNVSPLPPEL